MISNTRKKNLAEGNSESLVKEALNSLQAIPQFLEEEI